MIEILSEGHSCLETPHHMAIKEKLNQILFVQKQLKLLIFPKSIVPIAKSLY